MNSRPTILLSFVLISYTLTSCQQNHQHDHDTQAHHETKELPETSETIPESATVEALKIENLLRDSLQLAEGVEVVMSYLEVPPNTTLPAHWHPGEEFVYCLEGSGELTLNEQEPVMIGPGDVIKVPLKEIHSFSTFEEPAKAIVFRVHEAGQPDRILVEEQATGSSY